jgi:hypothetical protein
MGVGVMACVFDSPSLCLSILHLKVLSRSLPFRGGKEQHPENRVVTLKVLQ